MSELSLFISSFPETRPRDFSIIIAHRGDPLQLWATVHSCEVELEDSGYDYEYIIVANGEESDRVELTQLQKSLKDRGVLCDYLFHSAPLAPPSARQLGTESANGKYLFFFDNHCIVGRNYFKRAIESMEKYGMDSLHSVTRYLHGHDQFHYTLTLDHNFWGHSEETRPPDPETPYRIRVGGHGGFVVRKSTWQEVGGYGPVGMFQGWGGEETYFDLKLAQLGKNNWLDPKLLHYHYPASNRGYTRHQGEDFFRNLMLSAFLIGDDSWLDKVYAAFSALPRTDPETTMEDLRDQAVRIGQKHAEWLKNSRLHTLDEVLEHFNANNIA